MSHELKTSDLTSLLYHVWFPNPHIHISILIVLELLKNTKKAKFQHYFDLEFCEISNIFCTFKQPTEKNRNYSFLYALNELKFWEFSQNLKSNKCSKLQLSILKKKEVLFLKNMLKVIFSTNRWPHDGAIVEWRFWLTSYILWVKREDSFSSFLLIMACLFLTITIKKGNLLFRYLKITKPCRKEMEENHPIW